MIRHPLAIVVLIGLALSPLQASASDASLEDCIDLGNDAALRHNGAQFLYVRNGGDHYRVAFERGPLFA